MSRRSLQRASSRERSLSLGSVTRSPTMDKSSTSTDMSLSLSPAKGPKISMRMGLIQTKGSRKRLKDSGEDSLGGGGSGGSGGREGKEEKTLTSNSKNG